MIEKGGPAKGDAHHIERSGAHLGFQTGLRPAEVLSGVRVSVAQNMRNPSHVGILVPTCQNGISPGPHLVKRRFSIRSTPRPIFAGSRWTKSGKSPMSCVRKPSM